VIKRDESGYYSDRLTLANVLLDSGYLDDGTGTPRIKDEVLSKTMRRGITCILGNAILSSISIDDEEQIHLSGEKLMPGIKKEDWPGHLKGLIESRLKELDSKYKYKETDLSRFDWAGQGLTVDTGLSRDVRSPWIR